MPRWTGYYTKDIAVNIAKIIRNSPLSIQNKIIIAKEFADHIEHKNLFPFKKRDFVCIASGEDDKEISNNVIFVKRISYEDEVNK